MPTATFRFRSALTISVFAFFKQTNEARRRPALAAPHYNKAIDGAATLAEV